MEKKRSRYGMLVILGCCMLVCAVNGIGANCKGVFYEPVAEGLQDSLSNVTMSATFYGIFAACTMPICCWLFRKLPSRVFLSAMVLQYSLATVMMGFAADARQLCFWGAVQGIPGGFLVFYPAQYIIGNWFPEKKGSILGFVLMFSGIAGIVFNPLAAQWIESFGWRSAYKMQGIVILCISLPAALFFVFRSPAEAGVGTAAGNASEQPKEEKADDLQHRTPVSLLVKLFVFVIIACSGTALVQHLPNYATDVGHSAAFGAMLVSVSMTGNLVCKILFGGANDKLGAKETSIFSTVATGIGCLIAAVSGKNAAMVVGSFLIGIVLVTVSLQIPLMFRRCCDSKTYELIYPVTCSVNVLLCAWSQNLISMLYQLFGGSYACVFALYAGLFALCCVTLLSVRTSARRRARKIHI